MSKQKAPMTKKKKIILIILLSIAGVMTVAAAALGIHVYRILKHPSSFFDPSQTSAETEEETLPVQPAFTIETDTEPDNVTEPEDTTPVTDVPGITPTEEKPYEVFNVMLMGIDAYEDGSTSSGSMPHTDVTIVLAVNFKNNTVDMISLQRDTFTTAPG